MWRRLNDIVLKIIHIVENLDKGAVENLLINLFLESRKYRPEWRWTFFCILGQPGRLDEKVRNAGGEVIYSPVTVSNKIGFLKNLRKVLKAGQYDIIHSHHDYLSGFYLIASAGIKFTKRLLHIHNTDKSLPVGNVFVRKLLLEPFRRSALYFSDIVVGVSKHALAEFTGAGKRSGPDNTVLYHGIDLKRFDAHQDRGILRKKLDIPYEARLCLFVGRMNDLKNPVFAVEVLKHLLDLRKDVYFVFVGQGEKADSVRKMIEEYGIADRVRISGWNEDVPMVMKSSDVFVFPRKENPKEALGVVIVEAQAAGLPVFTTHGVLPDAIIIEELVHCNNLQDPKQWAAQIDDVLNKPPAISPEDSLAKMKRSPFELSIATKNLVGLYERG